MCCSRTSLSALTECELSDAKHKVASALTAQLSERLSALLCTASTWRVRRLSELATDLAFAHLAKPPSCAAQYVSACRQFAVALESEDRAASALDSYQRALDAHGLVDARVHSFESGRDRVLCAARSVAHGTAALFWLTASAPALLLWAPVFAAWRAAKRSRIAKGVESHYDGLAAAKMVPLMCLAPLYLSAYALCAHRLLARFGHRLPAPTLRRVAADSRQRTLCALLLGFVAAPASFRLLMEALPECVHRARHALAYAKAALVADDTVAELTALRQRCLALLTSVVERFAISSHDVHDALDRTDTAQLNGARKWEWTHACRVRNVPYSLVDEKEEEHS